MKLFKIITNSLKVKSSIILFLIFFFMNNLIVIGSENKEEFRKFVNTEVSFNPHNMFICKSKKLLESYYKEIFPWLENCEKLFGFDKLKGYGLTRIYGFLAERFLSYWFQKNTKFKTLPILGLDINNL